MNSFQRAVAERVSAKMRRSYRHGLEDGAQITLKLLLGQEAFGAATAPQPLPDHVREWAEVALAKVERDIASRNY